MTIALAVVVHGVGCGRLGDCLVLQVQELNLLVVAMTSLDKLKLLIALVIMVSAVLMQV
ncbi:hypothetical protein LPH55_07160 [Xylella taiwanensis]|uniref:Uncharacterized protein n=1 Tax=Xylella taiwanensis TaxID=1444770 RepID=A0ABS8TWF7_9GAMM|nr:hypothetical protein [Xylella taiwanensis]MCD8470169.1 hypothetical protein [Xylella taiwanensis]MCD8473238.1 hypothetical protein [Xylella taiwanensis]